MIGLWPPSHEVKLLEQIGLKGSGPHPIDLPETMQHIMKRDCCRELAVQEDVHRLPDHFHQSDPPEISALPLGDQDNRLPREFCGQSPIT